MGMVVTYNGTDHKVPEISNSDLVAFERHFKCKSSVIFPVIDEDAGTISPHPDGRMEHMLFLGHRLLVRTGVIARTVAFDDDFLDAVDITFVADEEAESDEDPSGAPAA